MVCEPARSLRCGPCGVRGRGGHPFCFLICLVYDSGFPLQEKARLLPVSMQNDLTERAMVVTPIQTSFRGFPCSRGITGYHMLILGIC